MLTLRAASLPRRATRMPWSKIYFLSSFRFYYRDWVFGYGACVMFPFFFYSNVLISTFSMALISVNR